MVIKRKTPIIMNTLETIFNHAGFHAGHSHESMKLHVLYMNNPDGTIRWVWPAGQGKPLFLKFYNSQGYRAALFTWCVRIIFIFRLQHLIFKRETLVIGNNREAAFNINEPWALFTGTTGPNRKAIFYSEQAKGASFIKVALNNESAALLDNEKLVLNRLYLSGCRTFSFPKRINTIEGVLQLTDVCKNSKRVAELKTEHFVMLNEIYQVTGNSRELGSLGIWQETKDKLKYLLHKNDNRVPQGMLRKLATLINDMDESLVIETSLSHGDYTPWNMYKGQGGLQVYDWELSKPMMPLGFDAFHFVIQQGILVEHKSWKQIEKQLGMVLNRDEFARISNHKTNYHALYLKLYLVINTVNSLHLYSRQAEWHLQVNWLLNAWNEALSMQLVWDIPVRELVVNDVFDFLLSKNYAALRFQDIQPGKISEESDIDLCIGRKASKELQHFVAAHPLVNKAVIHNKSFMTTVQLYLCNGSLLSLDLLEKIRRKNIVMMDASAMLEKAFLNRFGVKLVQPADTARYTGLFYALNNAQVPGKYQAYGDLLANEHDALSAHLYAYYIDGSGKEPLLSMLKSAKENKRFGKIKNNILYIADTLSDLFLQKGTVITFSGVDGAGKSTVIENIRKEVDKKLRRRVVVLRHRPSVLPILSAWTKGKKAAEQAAAERLPRQGSNTALIPSLLRFAYYYTDYFFGQFYIQLRYVMRGYTVLYDRYYFDFMADARRSNIELPAWLTKLGYKLLLKPHVNFFLYADSHVVLERKQELDKETIQQLTGSYLGLFESLGKHDSRKRYIPLENQDLKLTVKRIMDQLHCLVRVA
jgi:thymidylate kinase